MDGRNSHCSSLTRKATKRKHGEAKPILFISPLESFAENFHGFDGWHPQESCKVDYRSDLNSHTFRQASRSRKTFTSPQGQYESRRVKS
jgi:hypothetical protein